MGSNSNNNNNNIQENLILTPYIIDGNISEAQELAKVNLKFNGYEHRQSYSGFLTVDEKYGSNLFFWFFPTSNTFDPLVLWLQGGPGNSSLFGLFCENGPVSIDSKNLQTVPREYAWTKKHSMLYIDSPVGSGFSYTENDKGYATSYADIAKNLYNGLCQFFLLFPEYQQSNFYIAAESIGGKSALLLGLKIHKENNSKRPKVQINFKGVAGFAPYVDPYSITESYGDYFYNVGVIDEEERLHFKKSFEYMKQLMEAGENIKAVEVNHALIRGNGYDNKTYFGDCSGYSMNLNILECEFDQSTLSYISYLNDDNVRNAIHVGSYTRFLHNGSLARKCLYEDGLNSNASAAIELLNANYNILFTGGQFDVIVPFTAVKKLVDELLDWKFKNEFQMKKRNVWKLKSGNGSNVAGYLKQYKNLVHAFIRNAGHVSLYDQQEACLELISKFTRGCRF